MSFTWFSKACTVKFLKVVSCAYISKFVLIYVGHSLHIESCFISIKSDVS